MDPLVKLQLGVIKARNGNKQEPIHLAAEFGHVEICRFLLENVKEKNPKADWGETPYRFAAKNYHFDVCCLLMKHLDYDERKNPDIHFHHETLFHAAAKKGHLELCQLMIEKNYQENPSVYSSGETPLHLAAANGHFEICKVIVGKLVSRIGDVNPKNKNGKTPLHYAAKRGDVSICKLIVDNSKKKNPKDNSGRTPLYLARENNCEAVIELLRDPNPFVEFFEKLRFSNNANMCTSCEDKLPASYQCNDCGNSLCRKCYKAHSRLKFTRTHVVTPYFKV